MNGVGAELRRGASYRRVLLDRLLEENVRHLRGAVLDLGGKKERARGRFRGATDGQGRWLYLNIDTSTRPDVIGDAHRLPVAPASVDAVVCCEVLEHVRDARGCVSEVLEVLKPGGSFFFSVPFLYPIHADPNDFRRFTTDGVRNLCADFATVSIQPMGSWLGTVGMFLELGARSLGGSVARVFVRKALRTIGRFLCVLDFRGVAPVGSFTTGYFCIAVKAADCDYDACRNPESHGLR